MSTTTTFEVPDISCGHCARAITEAVKALDPDARVDVDLASKRVSIDGSFLAESRLAEALREAGYTPEPA
ncbi:heavy-metal-associated domain-containing protein [Pelomonas sp. KK5]|uniref:heavy-metal-associated domain-containing protein n=1 Tax=Pelomonas sp. KK5 TaxID=1855730 RepID=UPI00097BE2C9|nr:heavy-metal-associated domain-containing protein [Pelomonas sp. KK5]